MRKYLHKVPEVSFGRKFRLIVLSFSAMLLLAGTAYAQTGGRVNGVVTDVEGNPLVGAAVTVKGTMNVVISGTTGEFSLTNVDPADVLYVSYLGYKPQDVPLNGLSNVPVIMEPDVNNLEEVIVIGYGSLAKKELSSSVVQVSRGEFIQGAVSSAMELLVGKVAGLNVNAEQPANPNNDPNFQIRGAASLTGGNDPLVIVDGVAGGNMRALSPQDIASMTVLKDAASTAIYGTRGANGVILITTKRGGGSEGLSVTYDSYFAVNVAKPRPEVLTADEFRRARRGADYGYNTDWYSMLMRGFSYDHNQYLAIDGSSKNGSYGASFNWKDAKGLDIKTARREYGGRFYVEQRMLNNRLSINATLNLRRANETWDRGQLNNALSINPTMPVYNEDGTYYQPTSPSGASNPVAETRLVDSGGQRLYAMGTVEAKLNIIQNSRHSLNTSLNYSMNYNDLKQNEYIPSDAAGSFWGGYKGQAELRYQKWWKNRVEWMFNYTMDIGDHSLTALAGYSWEDDNWEDMRERNNDFAFDSTKWNDIGSGSWLTDPDASGNAQMESNKSLWKLAGVFARANYNWKDLLMVSAAFRYEGSTKFGANNKWGIFPSVSAAWEIANMPFLADHRDVVQSLKLRASFGSSGRSGIDPYTSLKTYSQSGSYYFNGGWVQGYRPTLNDNPNLKWERSNDTNIGIDFVLLDRLRGSIDLYDRQSVDLMYNYSAPQPPYLYNTILVNVGTIQNRGVEISLEYDVFKRKDFSWTTSINWAFGQTTLKKLSNATFNLSWLDLFRKPGMGTEEFFFRVREGAKIGEFYGYEYAGFDGNGNMLIYDVDNNKIPASQGNDTHKRYIGNGTPQHYLSWNNRFTYKNFDLDMFFTGAFGYEIFNMRKYGMGLQGSNGGGNVLRTAYTDDKDVRTGGGVISSYFLEKGDYFKLQNVTLGYNFAMKSKYVDNLRLYLSAKNVFTLTGYSGNDPSIVRTTGIEPGVDVDNAYPQATQITLGVTLRFK